MFAVPFVVLQNEGYVGFLETSEVKINNCKLREESLLWFEMNMLRGWNQRIRMDGETARIKVSLQKYV